jgi:hypothetical protein
MRIKTVLRYIGGIVLGALIFSYGCQLSTPIIPYNAQVFIDDKAKEFHAPMCPLYTKPLQEYPNIRLSTYSEAIRLEYRPDSICRDKFEMRSEPLLFIVLRRAKVLSELPDRVNADGTWNY